MASTTLAQEIEPQFRERYNAVYDQWQAGHLPFKDALDRIEALKQEAIIAGHLANQGGCELTAGIMHGYRANLNDSIKHFERARELFEKAQNRERMATCILNIGESYRLKGNFMQARRYFHAAYETAKQLDNTKMQMTALANEGQMLISIGRMEQALAALEQAYRLGQTPFGSTIRDENDRLDQLCEIHHALAHLYLEAGKPETAWEHARHSLLIARKLDLAYRIGFANRAIAEVLTVLGTPPDSGFSSDPDEYFQAAGDAFRELKADGELAKTMYMHGKSLARRGRRMPAARKLQQAMVLFSRLGMVDDAAKAAEAQLEVL